MAFVCGLGLAYFLIVLLRVVLSWFPMSPDGLGAQAYGLTVSLTEPLLGPLRRALPVLRMGSMGLDLSPIVLIFGLQFLLWMIGC